MMDKITAELVFLTQEFYFTSHVINKYRFGLEI